MSENDETTLTETEETVESQGQETAEKMLTQEEVNRILAKERRAATAKYNALKAQFDSLQEELDKMREKEEALVLEQVKKLREGQPDHILSLLDKLDPREQLEWLSSEDAKVVEKKTIPPLPTERKAKSDDKPFFRVTGL